jgi:hypothetical protein
MEPKCSLSRLQKPGNVPHLEPDECCSHLRIWFPSDQFQYCLLRMLESYQWCSPCRFSKWTSVHTLHLSECYMSHPLLLSLNRAKLTVSKFSVTVYEIPIVYTTAQGQKDILLSECSPFLTRNVQNLIDSECTIQWSITYQNRSYYCV